MDKSEHVEQGKPGGQLRSLRAETAYPSAFGSGAADEAAIQQVIRRKAGSPVVSKQSAGQARSDNRLFLQRLGSPTAMNPDPLIGIFSDHILNNSCILLRKLFQRLFLPIGRRLDRREHDQIVAMIVTPYVEQWHHGSRRLSGKDRKPKRGACGLPEKVDKHAFVSLRVLVHDHGQNLPIP